MFNSLTGLITGKFSKQVFIQTNGIEWDIVMPDSNIELISNVGQEAKIFTWLSHSENAMTLYGFSSEDERSVFLDLIKVDGVGPKGAVKIMSSASSAKLMQVLENEDLAQLEAIPGVGKKTAAKMMLALKGKLSITENTKIVRLNTKIPFIDVVNSLCAMGYDKKAVEQKIVELSESLSMEKGFETKSQKEKEDIIFRRAIVELA